MRTLVPVVRKIMFVTFSQHSVEITEFYCHSFFANFPSNQRFTKELYCKSIWRKNFQMGEIFWNFHIVLPRFFANFPSNQRFTKELYSKLIWRKKICMAVNFSFFHTVFSTLYTWNKFRDNAWTDDYVDFTHFL